MTTCGPGNPCTGANECCNGYTNKCGKSYYSATDRWDCDYNSIVDLCGPCTNQYCFYSANDRCQKQLNEYKDCKFTIGNCINKRRQITIIKQPRTIIILPSTQPISGQACPPYQYEECDNCIISDWTACTNNTRTRRRTQAINGGIACTQSENELPLTQTCANCEFTEWTNCLDNIRTKRITTFPLNTVCPVTSSLIQIQECYDCVVSNDWTGPCKNNVRVKEIIPSINGGNCPEQNNLVQTCNDCIGNWNNLTDCEAICDGKEILKIGSRIKKFTILHPATNGGVSCDIEDGKLEIDNNCQKKCIIGSVDCSKWSECDCNTNEITRSCDNNNNKFIQKKKCSEIELCNCSKNWSEWSECDCNTKTITRSCYNIIEEKNCNNKNCNIFNYLINFFKLIILFIMNLFK